MINFLYGDLFVKRDQFNEAAAQYKAAILALDGGKKAFEEIEKKTKGDNKKMAAELKKELEPMLEKAQFEGAKRPSRRRKRRSAKKA